MEEASIRHDQRIKRLLPLHALTGHPVDDAVAARVHVPDAVGDKVDGDGQPYHTPEDDVEYNRVVLVHLACQANSGQRITATALITTHYVIIAANSTHRPQTKDGALS